VFNKRSLTATPIVSDGEFDPFAGYDVTNAVFMLSVVVVLCGVTGVACDAAVRSSKLS